MNTVHGEFYRRRQWARSDNGLLQVRVVLDLATYALTCMTFNALLLHVNMYAESLVRKSRNCYPICVKSCIICKIS